MALPPNVLIYEFITGGGWPTEELPNDLCMEAVAMLWALLDDFRKWGEVHTTIVFDPRFEKIIPGLNRKTLPADEIILVEPGQYEGVFSRQVRRSDAVLVIAPETDGVLSGLSNEVEAAGKLLLGSSSAAVAITGDKSFCHQIFQNAGLPTPQTRQVTFATALRAAEELGFPLVTKPLDGVGCEGVCLAMGPSDLADALNLARKATRRDQILLQTYVNGIHASVSMLVTQDGARPLCLNGQEIRPGIPFTYSGGVIPLVHSQADRAFEMACQAVKQVPGLHGYVGVDLVLTPDEAWLIEINPRITTSYFGLRRVLSINLAKAIWDACCTDVLPERTAISGQVRFTKSDPSTWKIEKEPV
jgi:predicted ATP-grasp superfamily ATP-dependent carboligase